MAAIRCSPASASAPARATTSTTRFDRGRQQEGRRRRRLQGALVYGQMNEPPGRPRPRRAVGPDHRRAFPRPGPGRAVLRRQHLPLHAGGFGSVGAARPHPLGGGLSADAGHRHGRAAGAHHHDHQGLDHLGAGDLRARRRPDRPGAGHLLRPPRRDDRARRSIAEKGIYPAVDPLDSTSRMLDPRRRRGALRSPAGQETCSATSRCRTSSPFSAWTSCRKRTS
jgi:hypothetical protein